MLDIRGVSVIGILAGKVVVFRHRLCHKSVPVVLVGYEKIRRKLFDCGDKLSVRFVVAVEHKKLPQFMFLASLPLRLVGRKPLVVFRLHRLPVHGGSQHEVILADIRRFVAHAGGEQRRFVFIRKPRIFVYVVEHISYELAEIFDAHVGGGENQASYCRRRILCRNTLF